MKCQNLFSSKKKIIYISSICGLLNLIALRVLKVTSFVLFQTWLCMTTLQVNRKKVQCSIFFYFSVTYMYTQTHFPGSPSNGNMGQEESSYSKLHLPGLIFNKTKNWWYCFFVFFSQKTRFDISRKLETICMKCQNLFSGKKKKKNYNLLSADLPRNQI